MKTQTITVSDPIRLPKEVRNQWLNRPAILEIFSDAILIKRIEPPSWDEMLPKLQRAGKRLNRKVVKDAIACART